MVPPWLVAEALNAEIAWIGAEQSILIRVKPERPMPVVKPSPVLTGKGILVVNDPKLVQSGCLGLQVLDSMVWAGSLRGTEDRFSLGVVVNPGDGCARPGLKNPHERYPEADRFRYSLRS